MRFTPQIKNTIHVNIAIGNDKANGVDKIKFSDCLLMDCTLSFHNIFL